MFFYEVLLSGAAHFVYIAGLHLEIKLHYIPWKTVFLNKFLSCPSGSKHPPPTPPPTFLIQVKMIKRGWRQQPPPPRWEK